LVSNSSSQFEDLRDAKAAMAITTNSTVLAVDMMGECWILAGFG
jgi:hypothetical protein